MKCAMPTLVATAAVHWPQDCPGIGELARGSITDRGHGNYKPPLLFVAVLLPLVLRGAGRLRLDAPTASLLGLGASSPRPDLPAWVGRCCAGLLAMMRVPAVGMLLAAAGTGLAAGHLLLRR
jgi:putative oxidoreductase